MYYYVEKKDSKLIGKLESNDSICSDNFIEVTEEQYNLIKIPYNVMDNIFDIQHIIDTQNQESFILEKNNLIIKSKNLLAEYLQSNPLLFTDGKYYSVTQEKQNLLNNAITVYQMKIQLGIPAELKWNSTGEECTIWTLEDITALALAISEYVEPLVTYQQAIEVQIRNCTTREELESVVIDYATV
ncbi:hypothetical protein [Proteiniborus sp. MB09-C3]|uniref:DUF4376 domain-containing protein n=1 Tax=Proteiniborus sp. MB09-C3 TaxID=3050072 RepID=UPI0025545129|nr:hypothetical protein [Proteiniborus sp. MB09-C3]WIV10548.1 hypothetical protein QO263_10290 [Proteiniborus sp. MB09-C3]